MKTKRNLLIMVVCLCLCVPLAAPATDSPAATAAPDGPRIVKIAANNRDVIALDDKGKLYTWGQDMYEVQRIPKDLPPIKDISLGSTYAVALDIDGRLHGWGSPEHGVTDFQEDLPPISSISANAYQTIAISEDGRVFAWGDVLQMGQKGVPTDLGTVQKVSTGTYVVASLDSNGKVRTWGKLNKNQIEQTVRAVDIASCADSVAYLGEDGKIYGDITINSHASTFRKQPVLINVTKIFGSTALLGAIDRRGKLTIWGDARWLNHSGERPLWEVPTNLPPITDVEIVNRRVVCLGVDGKVYQWCDRNDGLYDNTKMPYAINGFLDNPPVFETYEHTTPNYPAYAWSEEQLNDAIRNGVPNITITNNFTLTQAFEPEDMILNVAPGVTLAIACSNFVGGDYIKNKGTIEVYGRMVFHEMPTPDAGKIVTMQDGVIEYANHLINIDIIRMLLGKDSIITSVSCEGGEGSLLTVYRDYTLPLGRTLRLNRNTTLIVPEGITFTVEGNLDMTDAPPPVVKGKLVQK